MVVSGVPPCISIHRIQNPFLLSCVSQRSGIRICFPAVRCLGPKYMWNDGHNEVYVTWHGLQLVKYKNPSCLCFSRLARHYAYFLFTHRCFLAQDEPFRQDSWFSNLRLIKDRHQSANAGSNRRGCGGECLRLITTFPTPSHQLSPHPEPGHPEHHGTHRCVTYAGGQECESVQVSILSWIRRRYADM
jgi:hypothetical protein